jgi:hypothetical protein
VNLLGELTEENNRQKFLARRAADRRIEKDRRARRLLDEIGQERGAGKRRQPGTQLPSLDPITVLALIGLGWLLGLLVVIGAAFALIRWVWDAVMRLLGV